MLTQERLKSIFNYNKDTGVFTRIKAISRRSKVGDIMSTDNGIGYIVIRLDKKLYYCHRLAWLYMTGKYPVQNIDHINGNRSDNRFCNLRCVDQSTNMQNLHKAHKDNASGFIGVTKDKKKWAAGIYIKGKRIHIGNFPTPEDAHIAYLDYKRIHHDGCTI